MRIRVFDFDDWPRGADLAWPWLERLRAEMPGFKATLFAIPAEMQPEHWQEIERRNASGPPWLEVAPHGFRHDKGECRMRSRYRRHKGMLPDIAADQRWAKLFKAPWFGYDAGCLELLRRHGFAIACKTMRGFPPANPPDIPCWFPNDRDLSDPTAVWQTHPIYTPRRAKSVIDQLDHRMVDSILASRKPGDVWEFASSQTRSSLLKINLGCGPQLWPGWQGLDHLPLPGQQRWSVGEPIPFAENMAELVFQSHLCCYIDEQQYAQHFLDVWRVLRPGGIFRIADDETSKRAWRKPGQHHKTGDIRSLPTRAKLIAALERVGFRVFAGMPGQTASPHKDVLQGDTRGRRFRLGHKYYLEAVKDISIDDLARPWRSDPRTKFPGVTATRAAPYFLPAG